MAEIVDMAVADGNQNNSGLGDKQAKVSSRLQQRDEERIAELQKRKEVKVSKAASNETLEYFLTNFARIHTEIENRLATLKTADTSKKAEVTNNFDEISVTVQTLQKFVSDSTFFLPSYQVQKSQAVITSLQTNVQELRDTLLPKKRFAFKGKPKTVQEKPQKKIISEEEKPSKPTVNVSITDCSFAYIKSQTLEKSAKEATNKDVALTHLEDCVVKIYGSPSAFHINKLSNCKVICGPVSGSIFVDECINCTFSFACQQLRIHNTTESSFYIHVTSKAIIEDCKNVGFAPYTWYYQDIEEHYKLSGLDRDRNNWDDVDDFNWLVSGTKSPNWHEIPESERQTFD